MNEQQKNQVQEAVNNWLDENNPERSQKKLADKSGVNVAYISQIKKGEFKVKDTPISPKYFTKVAEAVGLMMSQEHHWETKNFTIIQQVCSRAQQDGRVVLLDSEESGLGKTYGLEHYYHQHDKVVYVKCDSTFSARDLLNELLQVLRVRKNLQGNKSKLEHISERIAGKGWLLIIDEAELVKPALYRVIKDLIDMNRRKVGIVISGMGLTDKFERLAKRQKEGFRQINRRVRSNRVMLCGPSKAEVRKIVEAEGVLTKSAQDWFCRTVEDFQMLDEYLTDALKAHRRNQQVDFDANFLNELFL